MKLFTNFLALTPNKDRLKPDVISTLNIHVQIQSNTHNTSAMKRQSTMESKSKKQVKDKCTKY